VILVIAMLLGAEGLPKEEIAKVVKEHAAETKNCFEMELEENPKAGGKVTMKFTIKADGTTAGVGVASSNMSTSMNGCLAKAIGTWKFPAPPGGNKVEVSYPFVFKAGP
jgi:TonB family protein